MLAVIAKIPVQPEKKQEAFDAIKTLMPHVAKEEGTLFYSVNVSEEEPNTLVIIERYRDREALEAHGSTPHFKAFMGQAANFAAGKPEIKVYEEIESV